jgi:hypothetical protein
MPLVSDSQMTALRGVINEGMITEVTILAHQTTDNAYGDEQTESWPGPGTTVMGWLRTVPEGTIDVISGVQADVSIYRLFVPVGTEIGNNDKVRIEDRLYVVTDTNKESSYQVALKCSLRRAE